MCISGPATTPLVLTVLPGNRNTAGADNPALVQVNEFVTYTNAGTFNVTNIDLRLTLTANPSNLRVDLNPAFPNTIILNSPAGGPPAFADPVGIRFDVFAAGTTTPVQVPLLFTFKDIDDTGSNEAFQLSTADIQSYTLSNAPPTDITVVTSSTNLLGASGSYTLFTNAVSNGADDEERWANVNFGMTSGFDAIFKKRAFKG